jgi:hypothetical protein
MSFTIINSKDTASPPRPLLLVAITSLDGDTVYLATAADKNATSVTYGGHSYQCRIGDEAIDAIQAMSQAGFDQIPSFTLTIADPETTIWLSHAQAHGWRGATATLTFVLYDIPTSAYSTDAIQWDFLCENPTRKGANISLAATSKVNAQQIKIPSVGIQYRCPWNFPATVAQRQDGADNYDSIYYRCGYSPDATGPNAVGNYESGTTPFAACDFTRQSCIARGMFTQDSMSRTTGRFGGVTWVAPTTFVGTQYTPPSTTYSTKRPGYNQPNPARYNDPVPWVYGTQWVDARPLAPAADPNSLRTEAIVCLGDVGDDGILKVVCNGTEIPQGGNDVLLTWRYVNTGKRNGAVNTDAIFDGKGDPYGSICAIEVVIPVQLGAAGSIPNIRVLVRGSKVRKAFPIATATASGGEITFTFPTGVANTDCAGNPPFTVTVVGNSNPAFNGTFELSNWVYGPPGTITTLGASASGTGTGGVVFYNNSSTNPVWHLADLLYKTGWAYSQLNIQTFITAAIYCDQTVNYTDLAGNAASHARWRSSFALETRLPASQAITMLRRSCGLILHSSIESGLAIYIEQTLADQQPSAVSGSNYTTAVSSITAGGSPASGYLAYAFDESTIDQDSFEITAEPLNNTPNEFSIPFQDEDNQWQSDSLKQTDTDALASSGNRQLPMALEVLGPCNFDEAGRLANILLDKAQNGNSRNDHGGTIGFRFTTSMRAVHLATRPGYICAISWQAYSLSLQMFRVLSAKPLGKDGRKWEIRGTWHRDEWYEDASQQISVPIKIGGFRGSGEVPLPWKPDAATTTTADPVLKGASTFGIQQNLSNAQNGAPLNSITVSGIRIINSLSGISAPLVPVTATTSTSAGSIPAGTYAIQIFGIDSSNQYSLGSTLINAILTATGEITIPGISWDSGTSKYEVFCGGSQFLLQSVAGPTSGTPSSITLTSLPIANSKYGPPDPAFYRYHFRAKPLTQNGSWRTVTAGAMQVAAVSGTSITIANAAFGTNEWAGRTLALVSAKDTTTPSPLFEDVIVSNTATVLSMTSAAASVHVGDWVQVYAQATAASSTTITDSKWVNTVRTGGLTANAETGNMVRIIGGTGAGQTAVIASNTTTAITINGSWATTPDTSSIFWIEAPQWTYDYDAAPITVATLDASPVDVGNIPVDNFLGKSVLIEVLTEDQNNNFAPEYLAPLRAIYVPGAQGTRTVTGSTTITASDGTINFDTSGGNITQALPNACSMPNQDITLIKSTSDANTVTITGAASGTVILSQPFQSATFHSDGTTCTWTLISSIVDTSPFATKVGVQQELYDFGTDTGTANHYAVTLVPTPTIVTGSQAVVKVVHANTGASDIAVNGGSAVAIKKQSPSGLVDLGANDWQAGFIEWIKFDGTQWQWLNQRSDGTVTHTAGDLTADLPLFGAGGADIKTGTKTGNTDEVMSASGTFLAGDFLTTDSNGNAIDAGVQVSSLGNFATKIGVQQEAYTYAADTGTANAYAVALTPTPTLVAGSYIALKVLHANTGASTLATNGGVPIAVKKESSGGLVDLAPGDWKAGGIYVVVSDGSVWQWIGGGSAGGILLQVDGVTSPTQNKLNLIGLAPVSVSDDGTGDWTVTASMGPSGRYDVSVSLIGMNTMPGGSKIIGAFTFTEAVNFPANFVGSEGKVGANPSAAQTWTLLQNSTSIGTVAITTGGAVTFATSGPVSFVAGDFFKVIGSASQDATLDDVNLVFAGIRASVTSTPIGVVPAFFIGGPIPASQIICLFTFPDALTFPANWAGSYGNCGTNPTATATFTVKRRSGATTTTVGTVAVGTGGAFTFATTGGVDILYSAGDEMIVTGPATPDSTLADVAFSLFANASGFISGVTLNMPPEFSVAGNGTDTLTVTKASESANKFWGSPDGTSGVPIFRSILASDLPAGAGGGPDAPPSSPNAMDDEFTGSSLDSKWTIYNPASISSGNYSIQLSSGWINVALTNTTIQQRILAITQPVSGSAWRFRSKAVFDCATWNYFAHGMIVSKLVSGVRKNVCGERMYHSTYGTPTCYIMRVNDGTFSTETDCYDDRHGGTYMEVEYDGTNVYFRVSTSGVFFTTFYTETAASFLGGDPDRIGLVMHPYGDSSSNPQMGLSFSADWFRRMA